MAINNNNLQETKNLNAKSRQGNMTSSTNTSDYNSPDTQEARQLNSQSASGSTMASTTMNSANLTNNSSSNLQETINLNQKSRQNKSK